MPVGQEEATVSATLDILLKAEEMLQEEAVGVIGAPVEAGELLLLDKEGTGEGSRPDKTVPATVLEGAVGHIT